MFDLLDCAPSLDGCVAEVEAGLAFVRRTGANRPASGSTATSWLAGVLRGESSAAAGEAVPIDTVRRQPAGALRRANHPRDRRRHLRRSGRPGAAHRGGDAAATGCRSASTRPPWPGCCAGWPSPGRPAPATVTERDGLLSELDEVTRWLAARAADAPDNFLHLLRLVEAERAWAVGDFRAAALGFDAARREAAGRPRPWHRALITERAARFFLAHGLEHAGFDLLAQARQQYLAWGATAKVDQLDWAYPALRPPPDPTAGIDGDHRPIRRGRAGVTTGTLDLLGILSASQALSAQTSIDRLHARVVEVLGAMTGATGVHLLLCSEDRHDWLRPTPAGGTAPISGTGHEHELPMSVLRYVQRTGEPLVVADATGDDRFARDPYFTDLDCCSLLAVPILSRGTLRAVLLLENRLLRGAFTTDRLDAVTLIAGQLAVTLDNAQLYAELTASRARIVAAADHARRRIERDLHDGAQQRLVSLALRLRAAQAALPPESGELAAQLDSLVERGDQRAGRVARAGPRHPPDGPGRGRAGSGAGGTRPPQRRPRRAERRGRGAIARTGRDRRLLRGVRGADQHRQARRRLDGPDPGRHHRGRGHRRAAGAGPRRRARRRRLGPRHRAARPQRPRRGARRADPSPQPARCGHHPAPGAPAHRRERPGEDPCPLLVQRPASTRSLAHLPGPDPDELARPNDRST